jgi:hypothetical protein
LVEKLGEAEQTMKLKKYALLFGFALVIVLLLNSCRPETEPAVQNPPIARSTNTATSQAAQLPITRAAVTLEPSSTPTPSATIAVETPTPLPALATPTIIAITLTPLPTFPADELETAVAELLANPMNCDVPCWWGAMPGVTTVFEVQQFLNLHQLTDYRHNENQVPDYIELFIGFDGEQFGYRVMYSSRRTSARSSPAERRRAIRRGASPSTRSRSARASSRCSARTASYPPVAARTR